MRVLKHIPHNPPLPTPQLVTLHKITNLDLSLLKSSPLEVVKLLRLNKQFVELLRECPTVVLPVRRYVERMTHMCKT